MDLKEGDLVWFRQYDDMLGEGVGIDGLGIFKGITEDRGIKLAMVIGEVEGFSKRMGLRSGIWTIVVPIDDVWPA